MYKIGLEIAFPTYLIIRELYRANPKLRGEALTLADFARLADSLQEAGV